MQKEDLIEELEEIHFPKLVYYYGLYQSSNVSFIKCISNSMSLMRPNLIDYYNISVTDNINNELFNTQELQTLSLQELESYTSKILHEIDYCYLHIQKYRLYNGNWRIKGEF